jgi:hypothetical protein
MTSEEEIQAAETALSEFENSFSNGGRRDPRSGENNVTRARLQRNLWQARQQHAKERLKAYEQACDEQRKLVAEAQKNLDRVDQETAPAREAYSQAFNRVQQLRASLRLQYGYPEQELNQAEEAIGAIRQKYPV